MNRVIFLIDGFNLYHSVKDIGRDFRGLCVKWLNIHSLCTSFLYLISKDARLERIYYFTAFADHLDDPDVVRRHRLYMRCLESTGVSPELSRFKPKDISCPLCKEQFTRHEEKETDVAIGVRLLEILLKNECDTAILMTGDTDLIPAVKTVKRLFPEKGLRFVFPYRRYNSELAEIAPNSFKIHKDTYVQHQFSDPVVLPDGTPVQKPIGW